MSCETGKCRKGARCDECIEKDGLIAPSACSCDPRFRDVAHDIECPEHGLKHDGRSAPVVPRIEVVL